MHHNQRGLTISALHVYLQAIRLGKVIMRFCVLLTVLLSLCAASLGQTLRCVAHCNARVERFSIDQVDKSLDPCTDFFQYACSKWIKANPIPARPGRLGHF